MNIDIPYGKEHQQISIEESRLLGIYSPKSVPTRDPKQVMNEALQKPFGGPSFKEFLDNAKDVLLLVNDGTRPTPTAKVMSTIADQLVEKEVYVMVATGAHRAPTTDEWKMILGERCYQTYKESLLVHDAKNSEMTFLGRSKQGTEMHLNKRAMEADAFLVIGSVEPHYFAGYTGGRKAFLPGIASYETIQQNHKYALLEEAKALALQGNPVHEDMVDAMDVLVDKKILSIQTVLDREHNIYGATAGDIHASFDGAIDMAKEVFCVELPKKADIVVACAPHPMDIDLYQSQKALENGRLALKKDGILILVSECRDGIGGHTFFQLLSSHDNSQDVLDEIAKGYKLGYHKAAKIAGLANHASIWGVTGLKEDELKKVFITPKTSIQEALDEAIKAKGGQAKVAVFPEASITVPLIS